MKKYHVYIIGNALVDIDFEVSAETLNRLQVDKGVMTLIDEDRHHQLLEDLDGVKHIKACGGSAANTSISISQLGGQCFYSCKVAADSSGDFFYQDLVKTGTATNLTSNNRPDGVTGKCIVMVTPDADRTMNTFLGITADFSKKELVQEELVAAEYLYIEGYLVASPSAHAAALSARDVAQKNNVKVALTLSDPNMVLYFKQQLLEIVGDGIDLLFCNEREALLFCDTDDLKIAEQRLRKITSKYVITLGPQGCIVYNGEQSVQLSAHKTKAIDTVGAGDVFAGTFLYGITQNYPYHIAADVAGYAAAQVVSKFGPRLDDNEMQSVKNYIEKVESKTLS